MLNTTQIALLRAAFLKGRDAREAFQTWQSATDLNRLPPDQYALLPMLYHNLAQMGIDHPWLGRLKGIYRKTWYANQMMLQEAEKVSLILADACISVMLADDAPLTLAACSNRLRPISTLTVIVPIERVWETGRILVDRFWRPHGALQHTCGEWQAGITGLRFCSDDGRWVIVYGHAMPFWPSDEVNNAAWGRALHIPNHSFLAVGPTDQLIRSCRSATLPGSNALISLANVAILISSGKVSELSDGITATDQEDEGIDWAIAWRMAQTCYTAGAMKLSLACVAEVLEADAPANFLIQLNEIPISPLERLEGYPKTSSYAGISRIQALRRVYADYYRTVTAGGLTHDTGKFSSFLLHRWGLASRWQIPGRIIARIMNYEL